MKLKIAVAAILLAATAPAFALDADPASFRRDPHTWVRNTLTPSCQSPSWLDAPACNCIVRAVAKRITEADIVGINQPGATRAILARVELGSISFFCMKGQTPPD